MFNILIRKVNMKTVIDKTTITVELQRNDLEGYVGDDWIDHCVTVCCVTSSTINEEVIDKLKKSVTIRYPYLDPKSHTYEEDLEWQTEDLKKDLPFKLLTFYLGENPSNDEINKIVTNVLSEDTNIVLINDVCLFAGIAICSQLSCSYPVAVSIYEKNETMNVFKGLKFFHD